MPLQCGDDPRNSHRRPRTVHYEGGMAHTFHRSRRADEGSPVVIDLDAETARAFRTTDGETIRFDGATRDEAIAKANEFLTWAG